MFKPYHRDSNNNDTSPKEIWLKRLVKSRFLFFSRKPRANKDGLDLHLHDVLLQMGVTTAASISSQVLPTVQKEI
ncbi:MAG: hypothetical protein JRN20_00915 [Nitrososphaerota archaeon]|nr:hypothetical protein [Nitrososphaerota archaeon]MDG6923846.1 hypothetical protein [Nitrososphaerota archaeon]